MLGMRYLGLPFAMTTPNAIRAVGVGKSLGKYSVSYDVGLIHPSPSPTLPGCSTGTNVGPSIPASSHVHTGQLDAYVAGSV